MSNAAMMMNQPIGRPLVYRDAEGNWVAACRSSPHGGTSGTYSSWSDAMDWATRRRPRRWLREALSYT